MSQSFRDPRNFASIDSHLSPPSTRPQSPPNHPPRPAGQHRSLAAQQIHRQRSGSESSHSEYSTRASKSVTNLRRMAQPRAPFSSLYTGDPRYPPMSPYPESSKRESGAGKHERLKTSNVSDDEETFGQERPLPQLSARTLPQKKHQGKERAQRAVEDEACKFAPDQHAPRGMEQRGSLQHTRVRKSISLTSHSLPLPSRSAYDNARVRTASPAPVKISKIPTKGGHVLETRASSSYLSVPQTSTRGLKPVVSAHELRSKPEKRDITPTDSVMGVLASSSPASSPRQDTVVSRKKSGRRVSPETMNSEPEPSQDAIPAQQHISLSKEAQDAAPHTQLAPRISAPPPQPSAPKSHPKKSAWKSLSSSIGKATDRSRRSISGLFGLMSRDPQAHVKTVDEAMAETTLFLNGFSKMSAFKRDYNGAMLRELEEVQRRYAGGGDEETRDDMRARDERNMEED